VTGQEGQQVTEESGDGLLRELIDLPPAALIARLQDDPVPALNWLGLAEVASMHALPLEPAGTDVTMSWARVAEIAYERLAADAGTDAERSRYAEAMARLRADLIKRHGPRVGDPFLDCDHVIEWFLSRHATDLEAAERDADGWRDLPIERIRELRKVKNELAIIARLERCPRYPTPEIQRWLSLRGRLP